jgi:hypothetical protein
MQYRQMVDPQTVSDCKGKGFAPPFDDSLGAAAAQPFLYPQQRNVVIPNWHSSQSWHRPGAVAAL